MDPDWVQATRLVANEEAFYAYPYDDLDEHWPHPRYTGGSLKGTATIGYGETNRDIVNHYISSGGVMSEPEARDLLVRQLHSYWDETKGHFTINLNPNQAAAVLSMAYNAGPDGMAAYAPRLLAAINEGRFSDAAELWKSSIITSQGRVLEGLKSRRLKEAALFATPYIIQVGPETREDQRMFVYFSDGVGFLYDGARESGRRHIEISGPVKDALVEGGVALIPGDMAKMIGGRAFVAELTK